MIALDNLPQIPNVKLRLEATGSSDWHRIFIETPDGITIGRINLNYGKFYNFKFYRDKLTRSGSRFPFDGIDLIYSQLIHFNETGEILSEERYDWTVQEALRLCREHYNEIVEQRRLHPTGDGRKRKPIVGWDPRIQQRLLVQRGNIPVEVTFG